jgi:hypothetical protein
LGLRCTLLGLQSTLSDLFSAVVLGHFKLPFRYRGGVNSG